MIEDLHICCSCKSKSVRRCIKCDIEIFSSCDCIINGVGHGIELETEYGQPNIIIWICQNCKTELVNKNTSKKLTKNTSF